MERQLVEADRHIGDAKRYIARQRRIVQRLKQKGTPGLDEASRTLAVFEGVLRQFEAHRCLVLDRIPVAPSAIKASELP